MKDLMDDEDLKKSVIEQMMGELDDVTASSLKRKPEGAPVKGVEISITVSPKSEEALEDAAEECDEEGCMDPEHGHEAAGEEGEEESDDKDNYIGQLMKKLG